LWWHNGSQSPRNIGENVMRNLAVALVFASVVPLASQAQTLDQQYFMLHRDQIRQQEGLQPDPPNPEREFNLPGDDQSSGSPIEQYSAPDFTPQPAPEMPLPGSDDDDDQ
jgi:hypothetical protein